MKRDEFRLDFMELDILRLVLKRPEVKKAFLEEAIQFGHCDGEDKEIYRTTKYKITKQFIYCDD